ncbi:hypothetical protein JCM8547_003576 [Rhodosporidiobolus lusitaniae]
MTALPPGPPFKRIRTDGFACYSLAFSPFYPAKLAVAGAANFGLVGNGRLSVVNQQETSPVGVQGAGALGGGGVGQGLVIEKGFDTQDGLYDLAWSECHENQIAVGSGDGSVKLFDIMVPDFPIMKWHEHQREVFSVDWSNTQKQIFCTSSWDGTVKIWTPTRPSSLSTLPAHSSCVYAALFSPSQPSILASCSSDGSLKVWDTRSPAAPGGGGLATPQLAVPAHPGAEVLDLDWNKYDPNIIATASVDRTVKVHDLRAASSSSSSLPAPAEAGVPHLQGNTTVATLLGHEYAVRRVAWSPHSAALLATGSYDMTSRVFSVPSLSSPSLSASSTMFTAQGGMGGRLERVWDRHTEFVVGVGWSLYEEGVVASCGWDGEVMLWQ